jgi:signal transduction histidine kinase
LACRWRIRHKLMIGLGLVVLILGILVLGTFKGLASYQATTKSIDSKLVELSEAQKVKSAVTDLLTTIPDRDASLDDERALLQPRIAQAKSSVDAYRDKLQDTLNRNRDPDKGIRENQLIEAFRERFARLDQAISNVIHSQMAFDATPSLRNSVSKEITDLAQTADELQIVIYEDLFRRIYEAKGHYKSSFTIVLSTSVLGVLLMFGLLRFFYRWTFSPIRDLQQGVGRVAEGNFEHRIEVHSGDEMEELAMAFNDMTSRLQETYHDLARQVNERSRQLVRSERLASVGFLAAGVAHEINNPLASIAFCSEALEGRLIDLLNGKRGRLTSRTDKPVEGESDAEVVTKYLKMIQQEAFRCKAITQRLLEFSRGGERRREPTDLAELVQSVLDVVQHLENSKNKQIVFEPIGRFVAWVNAQEIKSVVLNLVVNALESMDDGGTLTITLSQRDRMAEMVFRDTGCGMTTEILENIFEPFFTRSRTGKGTGLGLSISHRVITQHAGEIEASSKGPNQGSTFTVRLPLKPVEAVKEETPVRVAA